MVSALLYAYLKLLYAYLKQKIQLTGFVSLFNGIPIFASDLMP